ncbi:MAG: FkbM family methyltransferase [Candidatus Sericytochromatia bacterium]
MTLISHQETMTFDIRGQQIQMLFPSDIPYAQKFKQVHLDRPGYEYEAVLMALLERVLKDQDAPEFLDLGSFIGYHSVVAAKMAPKARVWAIESNPRFASVIEENFSLNGLENARVVHTALSDASETVRSIDNEVFAESSGAGTLLQAETGDAMCRRLGIKPTVAKMDVHGFEGKVIGGMKEVLAGPLQVLLLELHMNVYLEKYTPGITRMQILDALEAAGFRNYYLAGHRYSWSDGMQRFFETGRFAYQPLDRETRGMLLFDRHNTILVVSTKSPLEDLIGPSILDPSLE